MVSSPHTHGHAEDKRRIVPRTSTLGFETSALPGEGKPIPQVLVSLGNTLRTNKIDPGAMINEVFKEAIQFPTETTGMKVKFPAGDDKYMKLFAKPIGKLSSLEGIDICLSSLLKQLSTMGAPDEFAQIASFLFQFQGDGQVLSIHVSRHGEQE